MLNLIHNILAADEPWTENIVFLVIIGFWVLGAIVKGLSKKAKKEAVKGEEGPASPLNPQKASSTLEQPIVQSLTQKLSEIVDSYNEKQANVQQKQESQQIPVHIKPKKAPAAKKSVPAYSQIKMDKQSSGQSQINKKKREKKKSTTPVLFDNADELKKAVLYYEILGKPVSLREKPFY